MTFLRRGIIWVTLALATAVGPVTAAQELRLGPDARASLIDTIVDNVGLEGDPVARMQAQENLRATAMSEPEPVAQQVLDRLGQIDATDPDTAQARIALIEVLRDIGPGAAAALPSLTAIANDQAEPNEWVRMVATQAVGAIGSSGTKREQLDVPSTAGLDVTDSLMRAQDPNADVAAAALGNLIAAGHYDEAAPALTTFLARSDRAEDFLMSLGWSVMHGALPESVMDDTLAAVQQHLAAHTDQYTVDERVRLATLLGRNNQ